MKKMKRTLALLLAACMLLGLLASCNSADEPDDSKAPDATGTPAVVSDEYPIEPEELGSGEVKWSEEKTADGWMKVANDGGETLGYSPDSGVKLIQVGGYAFKDLNRNGKLDLYEDWRQEDSKRAEDLASQLPVEMMFGLMLHPSIYSMERDGSEAYVSFEDESTYSDLMDGGVRSALNFLFTTMFGGYPFNILATWTNTVQARAESLDYGIPVNISTNPGYLGYADNLALAASFDPELVADVYEHEAELYRSIGVVTLLGPMMDLTDEPRWNRISGTFGEDPALAMDMADAAVSALQSTYAKDGTDLGWGEDSVIAMMKHFPGDGSGDSGRESHSDPGKYAVYPGGGFETALIPYVAGALKLSSATGTASAAMTSYSIAYSDSNEYGELVGTAYSEYKIGLLRETYDFDGLICTDWNTSTNRAWGMEDATEAERLYKMIKAGVDQIGGTTSGDFDGAYELLVDDLGEDAALARIQESARRILKTFFQVGLFENSYVSVTAASEMSNSAEAEALSYESQARSVVMLKNSDDAIQAASNADGEKPTVYIPMQYANGKWALPVSTSAADELYHVVTDTLLDPTGEPDRNGDPTYRESDIVRASASDLAGCDFALVIVNNPTNEGEERTGFGHDVETGEYFPISLQYGEYVANTPSVRTESISGDMLESNVDTPYGTVGALGKENRAYYGASARITNHTDLEGIQYAADHLPASAKIVVAVNADRPMIFSEFESQVDAILIGFAIDNDIFLDIVSGKVEPSGLLPLQMPADMETVEAQLEDVPRDMECYVDADGNTYDFAFGLNWSGVIQDARTEKYSVPVITTLEEALAR